jgi:hypothetical protein
MLENVCNEGSRDKVHLVGTAQPGVPVSPSVLEKYTGRYVFSGGSRVVAGFVGVNQNVSMVDGRLYLNALPMMPESETKFESTGANAEFFLDANGKVTRLVLRQTEGEATYDPKR